MRWLVESFCITCYTCGIGQWEEYAYRDADKLKRELEEIGSLELQE